MARTTKPTRQHLEHANPLTEPHQRFIKLPEVKALTTLSTSEIYRRIAAGTFPKQVLLGPKSSCWLESQVIDWKEAVIRKSREEAA
jgi:prophage regulatory protein